LFDWVKDEKVLKEGPFESRVLDKPLKVNHLLWNWSDLLKKAYLRNENNRKRNLKYLIVLFPVVILVFGIILFWIYFLFK
jgi:hypothetical protein